VERLIFWNIGREPDIFLLYIPPGQSWKYNQHQKTRLEDIDTHMLWTGLKDKIDFLVDNNLVYTFNRE
jgi:hypothetical protein